MWIEKCVVRGILVNAAATRSAPGDAERCQTDTSEISAGYARKKWPVKLSQLGNGREDHRVDSEHRAARRRGQCPKPRMHARAVGAERRGIDGAEHSSRIGSRWPSEMLRDRNDGSRQIGSRSFPRPKPRSESRAETDTQPGRERPSGTAPGRGTGAKRGVAHAPAANQSSNPAQHRAPRLCLACDQPVRRILPTPRGQSA